MVSKSERRRRVERERWERQQQRREAAAQRARRRRRMAGRVGVVVVVVAMLATGGFWIFDSVGDAKTEPQSAPSPDGTSTDSPTGPPGVCAYADTGESSGVAVDAPPANPGDLRGTWTAALQLNGQPVTVQLFAERAPCTVNSLRFLAEKNYFDNTECHRLTTQEALRVLQCGDPSGSGSGGPGYQFGTENTADATYPTGTVAMARSSDPNSNGSQFFLVYADTTLPPEYTVFGKITSGLEAVTAIAAKGTADGSPDGRPKEKVVLNDLTVTRA